MGGFQGVAIRKKRGSYVRVNKAVPTTKICEGCKLPYLVKSDQKHIARQNRVRKFCSVRCQRSSRAKLNIFYRPHYKYEGFVGRNGVFVPWHVVIACKALGRELNGRKETVHHCDGDKRNNANDNLLICTPAYHKWLHQKMGQLWQQEHLLRREF